MPRFSKSSKERLYTCDDRLQKLFNQVIRHYDCTIIQGHRGEETQNEYFRQGVTKVKYPNSKHNSIPSKAVDVMPYFVKQPHIRWQDYQHTIYFAGYVMGMADAMGIKIRWGGDWNMNKDLADNRFDDYCHYELKE